VPFATGALPLPRIERCRCRATLILTSDMRWVCPECFESRSDCECQPLSRAFDNDDEALAELEHCIHEHHSTASDVIELAREHEVPASYLGMALRDADWDDQSIEEIIVEVTGYDPRIDGEIRRDDERVRPTWSATTLNTGVLTMARKADNTAKFENTPAPAEGKKVENMGDLVPIEGAARAPRTGREPLVVWMGVPLYNPHAFELAQKVVRDVNDGKLDPTTPMGRLEIQRWTDLILRQEQIYGQMSFALRTFVLNSGNFSTLVARVLGRPVNQKQGNQASSSAQSVSF